MTNKIKFLLPTLQVGLAIALGSLSNFQYQREIKDGIAYDYIPPAGLALHLLNLPVALILSLATRNASLQIGPQHSLFVFIIYLAAIGTLWFVIGWRLTAGPGVTPQSAALRKAMGLVVLLTAMVVAFLGALSLQGPLSLLIPIFSFLWAIVLVALFGPWLLRAGKPKQHGPPAR